MLPKLQRTGRSAVDPHGSSTTSLVFGGRRNGTLLAKVCRCARADRLPFPTASGSGHFTMKLLLVVAVPSGVVTVTGPDVAPAGTVTLTFVAVSLMIVASVPANSTSLASARLVPVIVTVLPTFPESGENRVIVGPGRGEPISARV